MIKLEKGVYYMNEFFISFCFLIFMTCVICFLFEFFKNKIYKNKFVESEKKFVFLYIKNGDYISKFSLDKNEIIFFLERILSSKIPKKIVLGHRIISMSENNIYSFFNCFNGKRINIISLYTELLNNKKGE